MRWLVLARSRWLPLTAALLLAVLLRAPFFGAPLGVDEGGYAYIARAWSGVAHPFLYGHYWVDRPPLLLFAFRLADAIGPGGVRLLGCLAALCLVAATYALARAIGGERVAAVAAVFIAVLTGSAVIDAVYTPGELLAVVPSTLSVAAAVVAHRRGESRWLIGAGALAVAALLIKQSALDALLAGAAFVAVAARVRARRAWPLAYLGGIALAAAALGGWMLSAGIGPGVLANALFGFRLTALHALATSDISLPTRLAHLSGPLLASGLALALPLAVGGFAGLRRDRALTVLLVAWLAAGVIGVLAGGSYWPHYLIEIAPACAVGSALAVSRLPAWGRRAALGAVVGLGLTAAVSAAALAARHPTHSSAATVGTWIRRHARPGDTQYVLYARANVAYYDGLPTPYPYAWSLMLRARPDAMPRLRAMLRSPHRPTWVVAWQSADRWRLDPAGVVARMLTRHYRRVAVVAGHPILHRLGRPRS